MPSFDDPDRQRLTGEDLDRIRARLAARANLGVAPTSPAFLDVIPGSIFADLEGPAALELDEFYDFAEIVVAATIPSTSFGEWLDDWAESVGLERRGEARAGGVVTFTGAAGSVIPAGTVVTTVGQDDEDPIGFVVDAGGVIDADGATDFAVTAEDGGSRGNVAPNAVTTSDVEIPGVVSLTNAAPMSGGADVENDEQLSRRVVERLAGASGSGTVGDYVAWGMAWPGVGHVYVRPVARGPGTVDVYITDLSNDPMPPSAVAGLQTQLDPSTGSGLGLAPIGHDVDVLTPGRLAVDVSAAIVHEPGYTLDGTAGTRATRAGIAANVGRYVNGRGPGDDVVAYKVASAFVQTPGVANIGALTINGVAGDLAVPDDQVPYLDDLTLA